MQRFTRGRRLLGLVAVALTLALVGSTAAHAANPFPRAIKFGQLGQDNSFPAALATSLLNPAKNPAGANDWSCTPTAKHPYPVVLVHGSVENAYNNWNGLSPIIKDQGYCVFALNYGNTGIPGVNATADLVQSAGEIGPFVDQVLAATGATQVDLIGHSQGGAQIRYYTNLLGGAPKVNQVIGIASSNHPTTLSGITELGRMFGLLQPALAGLEFAGFPSLSQQADRSPDPQAPFYQNLNGAGETIPGERYITIATRNDEIVTPYQQAFLTAGPGATVENITIQDVCAIDQSEHLSLPYSKNVAQIVLNKLDPNDVRPILCYAQAPVFGNTQLFG